MSDAAYIKQCYSRLTVTASKKLPDIEKIDTVQKATEEVERLQSEDSETLVEVTVPFNILSTVDAKNVKVSVIGADSNLHLKMN